MSREMPRVWIDRPKKGEYRPKITYKLGIPAIEPEGEYISESESQELVRKARSEVYQECGARFLNLEAEEMTMAWCVLVDKIKNEFFDKAARAQKEE